MENRDGCGADMLGLGTATAQTAGGAIGLLETQAGAFYAITDIEARD